MCSVMERLDDDTIVEDPFIVTLRCNADRRGINPGFCGLENVLIFLIGLMGAITAHALSGA